MSTHEPVMIMLPIAWEVTYRGMNVAAHADWLHTTVTPVPDVKHVETDRR